MPEIKFEGIEELKKVLIKNADLNDVEKVVRKNGEQLQKKAQRNAQFKGHYEGKEFVKPIGNLKKSIGLEITNGGFNAEVEPTAEYAAYVELGTRFMDAQPYLKPAFDEQSIKFESDMKKLVK